MKTKIYARLFLVIFITHFSFSCGNRNEQVHASEKLLNSLSERFANNDYVNPADVESQNPFEAQGDKGKLLAYNFNRKLPFAVKKKDFDTPMAQYTPYKLMGIQNAEFLKMSKGIYKEIYQEQGFEFSNEIFDAFNSKLLKYELTSEGVTSLLSDAEQNKTLTPLQRRVMDIQLQELSTARTNAHAMAICATVEYEIIHSGIDQREKNRILIVNSLTRNSFENDTPERKSMIGLVSGNFEFKQVGGGMAIFIVVFLASVVIAAFTCNPNDIACNLGIGAMGLIGAAYGTTYDNYTANGTPCGSEYPCARND